MPLYLFEPLTDMPSALILPSPPERNGSIGSDQTIVVGVSGGADSMVLLHLLHLSGYKLVIAHCNFHLRGQESDRDMDFVVHTCQEKYPEHPLEIIHFETATYAREHHCSIEMAARRLRYQWFEELRQRYDASLIAVAHHADDDIETLLLNLSRGTGGQGLRGMAPVRDQIWRPLLRYHRAEINSYLQEHHLEHVEDSTNSDTEIRRNLIRHRLIPLFEQLNPSFRSSALASMQHFAAEQSLIDSVVTEWQSRYFDSHLMAWDLNRARTGAYAEHLEVILLRCLMPLRFSADQVRNICMEGGLRSGTKYYSQGGEYGLELFRGWLYLYHGAATTEDSEVLINGQGSYVVRGYGRVTLTQKPLTEDCQLRISPMCLDRRLRLRRVQPTDRFTPFGMQKGSRLLMDYLKDVGVPSTYRTSVMVLVASRREAPSHGSMGVALGGEEVIAVPPLQIAHSAAVKADEKPCFISLDSVQHPVAHLLLRAALRIKD